MINYDDLPMFLTVKEVSKVLGIARNSAFNLCKTEGFPCIRIFPGGKRIVVPRDKFIQWVEKEASKPLPIFIAK